MARNPSFWTMWFNINHPWESSGDMEKTESILKSHGPVCRSDYAVSWSQCKHVDQDILFDRGTSRDLVPDVLRVFCTNEGVTCRDKDQPDGHLCGDYAIRFNCEYTGEAVINAHMFNRHSVSLYYILLVIPIIITLSRLLWIFAIRPWRDRRSVDTRPLPRQIRWTRNGKSLDLDLFKPPPSYRDIFGETGHRGLFVIPRGISSCAKCQKELCPFSGVIPGRNSQHALPFSRKKFPNQPWSELDVSTISEVGVSTLSAALNKQNIRPSYADSLSSPSAPFSTVLPCTRTHQSYVDNTKYLKSSTDADLQNLASLNAGTVQSNSELTSGPSGLVGEPRSTHSEPASPDSPARQTFTNSSSYLMLSLNPSQLLHHRCECACHSDIQLNASGQDSTLSTDSGLSRPSHRTPAGESGPRRVHFTSSPTNITELPSYEDALKLMKTTEATDKDINEYTKP